MSVRHVIGIDIGGTKCAAALYDADTWEIRMQKQVPTSPDGFPAVLAALTTCIDEMRTSETVAIGVGVPGFVQQPEGVIRLLPNIPDAEGYALKKFLETHCDFPVAVGNDSQTFALAEALLGAGKGESVVIGITMGTGLGGGIVIDGKIFSGAHGIAGELGHTLLLPGRPPYETEDRRGEAEQFLSGTAMRKRCAAARKPEDLLAGEACAFLHPSIVQEAAWLITNLTYTVNPSVIVFGGSAGRALEPYLPKIADALQQWTLPHTPLPQLKIRQLEDAATRGAALLALDNVCKTNDEAPNPNDQ